jgi:hypothetical protein
VTFDTTRADHTSLEGYARDTFDDEFDRATSTFPTVSWQGVKVEDPEARERLRVLGYTE